jgi:hypothetical protein
MEIPQNIKIPSFMAENNDPKEEHVDLKDEQSVSVDTSIEEIVEENTHKGHPNFIRSKNDGTTNFYTKIDSRIIKNEKLNFLSIGIMAWMLSQDKTFKIFKTVVQRNSNFGKNKFEQAWNKLESLNYIVKIRERNEKGQFDPTHWIINEDNSYRYENTVLKKTPVSTKEYSDVENNEIHKAENHILENPDVVNDNMGIPNLANHHTENEPLIRNQINKDQPNQNQPNQDQPELLTNGAEGSARSKEIEVPSSADDLDTRVRGMAPVENVDYFVANPTSLHEIPEIRSDQFDIKLLSELQPYFDNEEVRQVCHLYSYLVWKNIRFFKFKYANTWKMNHQDYKNLLAFCTDQTTAGFEHIIHIADSIFEKALKSESNLKYVSVSYLTSQVA